MRDSSALETSQPLNAAPLADMAARSCAITVTYGDRFDLLKQVIDRLMGQRFGKIIVVDNGCAPASQNQLVRLAAESGGVVEIIALGENRGSAGGYRAGLEAALADAQCEYFWLLDDDNVPAHDAFAKLCGTYELLSKQYSAERLALYCMRDGRDWLKDVAAGVSSRDVLPKRSSFSGFHLADLHKKVAKRIFPVRSKQMDVRDGSATSFEIPFAPYGGLFWHRSAVSAVGLPDERFFVYADDIEYTYRFTQGGGKIFLCPESFVEDVEQSWHVSKKARSQFAKIMTTDSDFRVYYALRNQTYFDSRFWVKQRAWYVANKWAYLVIARLFSMGYRKPERFRLIQRAIKNGEAGELGRDDLYRAAQRRAAS